jgi:hypothetical protein
VLSVEAASRRALAERRRSRPRPYKSPTAALPDVVIALDRKWLSTPALLPTRPPLPGSG